MPTTSAGLLLFRRRASGLEVLLAHPGGPFFANKDDGAWTIPKGEAEAGEPLLEAARREFAEETGFAPDGPFVPLEPVTQRSGKRVHAWAVEGDWDPTTLVCNEIEIEWPARSGRRLRIPEIDRAEWCTVDVARRRLNPAQVAWVDALLTRVTSESPAPPPASTSI